MLPPAMFRRMVLPLALVLLAFGAFAWSAASFASGRDLAGLYFLAVALLASRAQQRVALGAA